MQGSWFTAVEGACAWGLMDYVVVHIVVLMREASSLRLHCRDTYRRRFYSRPVSYNVFLARGVSGVHDGTTGAQ